MPDPDIAPRPANGLLTYDDVCDRLQVSRRTVNRLVSRRQLPCVVLGSNLKRFRAFDVDNLINRRAGDRPSDF